VTALQSDLADAPETPPAPPVREVTIRPIPRREPPFDDEIAEHRLVDLRDGEPLREVVLGPWDQPLPFGVAELESPSTLRLVAPRDPFAARPTARHALPDPEVWTRRLLTTMFEVVRGRRPVRQLTALATPSVCAGFTTAALRGGRLAKLAAPSARTQIRSVRVCEPADGVAEVAVTVAARGRVHAVALRLEGLDGRWRCVKLEVG
jgi:hypothetical protein